MGFFSKLTGIDAIKKLGGGGRKTKKTLKNIDKRLGNIESTLESQGSQDGAVPEIEASMDAVDMAGGSGGDSAIEAPDMSGGMEPVPGAVDALQEDSFATATGSSIGSGLNMVKRVMRRNK